MDRSSFPPTPFQNGDEMYTHRQVASKQAGRHNSAVILPTTLFCLFYPTVGNTVPPVWHEKIYEANRNSTNQQPYSFLWPFGVCRRRPWLIFQTAIRASYERAVRESTLNSYVMSFRLFHWTADSLRLDLGGVLCCCCFFNQPTAQRWPASFGVVFFCVISSPALPPLMTARHTHTELGHLATT